MRTEGHRRLRQLADGARQLEQEHPQKLAELKAHIKALKTQLAAARLGPEHLTQRYTTDVLLQFLLRHTLAMVLGLPVVLLGALTYGLPFLVLRELPRWMRSPPDMLATQRILGGLVILPLWHLGVALALQWFLNTSTALALSVALPFSGLYAHAFVRRRRRMLKDAVSFVRLLVRPALRRDLLDRQQRVAAHIDELAGLLS